PAGARHAGKEACVGLWTAIATQAGTRFDIEETFVAGDRATIRWRYFMTDGNSLRGVNLMRVADGRIVQAMGYVKG
ncbi:nuclear transport factor 2 family protein, partial [Mesorhizobium sp. M7A.F.Ca.CA.001.16.1.1]|uniref:nuclear transport factor 2 family protein n=1 Tax=Mesorhizobium sp. M7A.F.Ca.CA.001.16.1.1 TaxID=2496683 RepID=UPI000FD2BFC4